ncbi:MAG: ATP-binding protein [Planctomycetes bacterium]|nr:ATP-binding protein [Planctomycetota bacterium]
MRPQINYKHVLRELSVNRQQPCEVIRELISNSYDASATHIQVYPLLQEDLRGFIFADNGEGMSETEKTNGITPYEAFFSVGMTTKTKGKSIGYKCQGSKLCFAASRFALATKTGSEKKWRWKTVDNPRVNLDTDYDLKSTPIEDAYDQISNFLGAPDERTSAILLSLREWIHQNGSHGSIIIVTELEVDDFTRYFDSTSGSESYLWNYIRFSTRHGDVRDLKATRTGFPPDISRTLSKEPGFNSAVVLELWNGETAARVPEGYPFLEKPSDDEVAPKGPLDISRLRDGRFFDRAARSFKYDGRFYSVTVAIDGNRRALEMYENLDRRGKQRSGMRLTDQRGVYLASQGIKVCAYPDIVDLMSERYQVLTLAESQAHYLIVINGPFDLVTNRTYLSESARQTLTASGFVEQIEACLDHLYDQHGVFADLVRRLNKETGDIAIKGRTAQLDRDKEAVRYRERFLVRGVESLRGRPLLCPIPSEEHWVGALYTMFSHLVPADSEYKAYWRRPLSFSARGIDSLASLVSSRSLNSKDLLTVEYKYRFEPEVQFNHPLTLTDVVIAWELESFGDDDQVSDEFTHFGYVEHDEDLGSLGFYIRHLESLAGESFQGQVLVLSLRELLRATFDVRFVTPPAPSASKKKKTSGSRRGKKRK